MARVVFKRVWIVCHHIIITRQHKLAPLPPSHPASVQCACHLFVLSDSSYDERGDMCDINKEKRLLTGRMACVATA